MNEAVRRAKEEFHPRTIAFKAVAKTNMWGKLATSIAADAARGAQRHIQLDNIPWSEAGLRRIAAEYPVQ